MDTKTYQCAVCNIKFQTNSVFKLHSYTHGHLAPKYNVICTICNKHFKSESSLHNHRSIHHRAEVRPYRRKTPTSTAASIVTTTTTSSFVAVVPSSPLPSLLTLADIKRRRQQNYHYMRLFLNLRFVENYDGNRVASDDALQRDLIHFYRDTRLDFKLAFHAIIEASNNLEMIEKRIPSMERILPFRCMCFCSLVPDNINSLQDAEAAFNEISSSLNNWHYHCILILKTHELCTKRTLVCEFERAFTGKRYLKEIRSLEHLLNIILYISGRQSNKQMNVHMFHALGYYISKEQKEYFKNIIRSLHFTSSQTE